MSDSRRQQYLHAMGVTLWQSRGRPAKAADQTASDSRAPDHDITDQADPAAGLPLAGSNAIQQWLIWLAEPADQQHSPLLIQDLQALCARALPGRPAARFVDRQPTGLTPDTAVLGIGLSEPQLTELRAGGQRCFNLPGLDEWHNQASAKQAIWHDLQQALWSP